MLEESNRPAKADLNEIKSQLQAFEGKAEARPTRLEKAIEDLSQNLHSQIKTAQEEASEGFRQIQQKVNHLK